jgi:hypothetical protein
MMVVRPIIGYGFLGEGEAPAEPVSAMARLEPRPPGQWNKGKRLGMAGRGTGLVAEL